MAKLNLTVNDGFDIAALREMPGVTEIKQTENKISITIDRSFVMAHLVQMPGIAEVDVEIDREEQRRREALRKR